MNKNRTLLLQASAINIHGVGRGTGSECYAELPLWLYINDVPKPLKYTVISLEDTLVSSRELQLVVVGNVADRPQWAQSKVRTSGGLEKSIGLSCFWIGATVGKSVVNAPWGSLLAWQRSKRFYLFYIFIKYEQNIEKEKKKHHSTLRHIILLLSVLNMSTHFSSRKYIWTNNPLQCRELDSISVSTGEHPNLKRVLWTFSQAKGRFVFILIIQNESQQIMRLLHVSSGKIPR